VVASVLLEVALWCFHPLPPTAIHKCLPPWTAIGPAPRTVFFDPGPLAGVTPGFVEVAVNRLWMGSVWLVQSANPRFSTGVWNPARPSCRSRARTARMLLWPCKGCGLYQPQS